MKNMLEILSKQESRNGVGFGTKAPKSDSKFKNSEKQPEDSGFVFLDEFEDGIKTKCVFRKIQYSVPKVKISFII